MLRDKGGFVEFDGAKRKFRETRWLQIMLMSSHRSLLLALLPLIILSSPSLFVSRTWCSKLSFQPGKNISDVNAPAAIEQKRRQSSLGLSDSEPEYWDYRTRYFSSRSQ
jgi:hypothetical protein